MTLDAAPDVATHEGRVAGPDALSVPVVPTDRRSPALPRPPRLARPVLEAVVGPVHPPRSSLGLWNPPVAHPGPSPRVRRPADPDPRHRPAADRDALRPRRARADLPDVPRGRPDLRPG